MISGDTASLREMIPATMLGCSGVLTLLVVTQTTARRPQSCGRIPISISRRIGRSLASSDGLSLCLRHLPSLMWHSLVPNTTKGGQRVNKPMLSTMYGETTMIGENVVLQRREMFY